MVSRMFCHMSAEWLVAIGWLQVVGSLKLHVSFAKYRLFYRALLQKRPIILRRVLIVATPYSGGGGCDTIKEPYIWYTYHITSIRMVSSMFCHM